MGSNKSRLAVTVVKTRWAIISTKKYTWIFSLSRCFIKLSATRRLNLGSMVCFLVQTHLFHNFRLHRGRWMEILREYGLGPRLQRLLQRHWDGQRLVTKAGKYYGRPFSTGRGVTQGDLFYPTLFNIIVDAVVRSTLQEICGPQDAQHSFGWSAGEHNIWLYADDGRIAGWDLI